MELITVARPYAKAAFGSAVEANDLAGWAEMLRLIAAVSADEKVGQVLSSPELTVEQQADTLIALCGEQLNEAGQRFVHSLAYNKRLNLLPQIVELFEQLKAEHERSVDVELVAAYPVAQAQQEKLAGALTRRLGREVKLHCSEDQSLIGGLVIRAGDLVIDDSVRGKLNKLANAMNS